ncbi:MAG: phosphate transport system permease protein [Planctomycetota bacterium]|jgi:phosphate transport system permease protein
MNNTALFLVVIGLGLVAFFTGRHNAVNAREQLRLSALPVHFGLVSAIWCAIPAILMIVLWVIFEPIYIDHRLLQSLPESVLALPPAQIDLYINKIYLAAEKASSEVSDEMGQILSVRAEILETSRLTITALVLMICSAGILFARHHSLMKIHARRHVESWVKIFLVGSSAVAIVTTVGIVLSVLFEALRFFEAVSIIDFIFGTEWSPQTAIREDQVGSSGSFGAVPLFVGTILISAIAMTIAVPVGLLTAIYLSEYATSRFRAFAKPTLELLAGIPTVVYGFFAALTVAPFIRDMGESIGLSVASESALAAGIVMGVMIIPFVSSLSDDVISAVPQAMRDGSLALGATRSETIKQVVIPAALPGIVGGVLLAASRAIGETMIVVMAAGLAAKLTVNPLEAVTTVTVQIVTLLTGDQEFDSPKTLAAFALGLMLFVTTLVLNVIALHIVRKYREQYE